MTRLNHCPISDCKRRSLRIFNPLIRIFLLITATMALTPVPAIAQTLGVGGDLNFGIPTSSQLFFEEGREQFDQEQQILIRKQSQSTEELLQIDENVQNHEALRDLEDPRLRHLPDPSFETSPQNREVKHLTH